MALLLIFDVISGITDDDLRETAYEILVASAGASGYMLVQCLLSDNFFCPLVKKTNISLLTWCFCLCKLSVIHFKLFCGNLALFRGLIVPSKEKKKEKKSKLMRKLRHSKNESIVSQSPRAAGLVGLLEILRAQLEACFLPFYISSFNYL